VRNKAGGPYFEVRFVVESLRKESDNKEEKMVWLKFDIEIILLYNELNS
jgi:hypothetical protein